MRLPGDSPVAGLVTSTVTRIADDLAGYRAADAARLSTVVVDLLGVLLGHAVDVPDVVAAEARQGALLAQVQAFIEQRLDDPALSPTVVAAAHYVASRTLDRLFAEHELTVAGWIRHRRLERCRRALANPLLADQPIYAIGTRMGFADGPHFTRAFRAAYGVSPRAYRDQHRPSTLQPTGKPDDES